MMIDIVQAPLNSKIFLSGPAGTGKTTMAVERLKYLLAQGVPGESILMLTPQRTMQEPYLDVLHSPSRVAGGEVTPATIGGLARRMCDLFWPLFAEEAGFALPERAPIFLTLETAQYYMAYIVRPLLETGYFESVTIDRNRLYSQIIDNLNKAAVIGFPHTEISARLDAAYYGDPAQRRVYTDAQDCANRFREYCLKNNLLDFSLQLEIFTNNLWGHEIVREHLKNTYRHLIYDNIEEDGPRMHDVVRDWLPDFDSALLLYDEGSGFRHFLGADIHSAYGLKDLCDEHLVLQESLVVSPEIADLGNALGNAITPDVVVPFVSAQKTYSGVPALEIIHQHYYPELLNVISQKIKDLLSSANAPAPSEIVILAPFLSDSLRFAITNRLDAAEIPWRTHRPSRSLHDESASRALIALAGLAHPHWGIFPPKFDVAYAFMQAIDGLDLIRAQLLTEIVYRVREHSLAPFDGIKSEMQERISYSAGERYTQLRVWLEAYWENAPLPLDHFFRKLFGEVLSQPGFGYHHDFDSVRVAANLIESVRKFRLAMEPSFVGKDHPDFDFGREYISMLNDGVISASYVEAWKSEEKDAVLVAPAHTYLMMNRPATIQFWLDPGSSGWFERLSQPLTHPYVLGRNWQPGSVWTDIDEVNTSKEGMARVVTGLLRRCRQQIYLGIAELGESGFEQRGELLRAFQKVL